MAVTLTQLEMTRAQYAEAFDVEFQQLRSRIEPYTTLVKDVAGDRYEWPRMGGTEMKEYHDTRHDIEDSDILFGKRSIFKRKFYNSIPISRDEVADMKNLDYTFARVKTQQVAAAARSFDAAALGVTPILDSNGKPTGKYRLKTASDGGYLGGILGTNYVGDGGLTQVGLNLKYEEGSNLIPVDFATTGDGISAAIGGTIIDKLLYVKQRLEESEVYDGTMPGSICVAISPAVKRMLAEYELAIHKDYGFKSLGEGGVCTINSYLNITFIVTNMLPTMTTEDKLGNEIENCRMCCAWLKNRIGFGVWKDTEYELLTVTEKVDVRHKQLAVGHIGCTRLDEDTTFVLPMREPTFK